MKFRLLLFLLAVMPGVLLAQPLNGNYTINSAVATGGNNFQSYGDFAASINVNGVSGHVVATVAPGSGPYQEQVLFSAIPGTGPNATVTLNGSGEIISAATTTTSRYVVRLANCQHFTVDNLRVVWDPASTGGFYGIHIFGTGSHIAIRNCDVDMGTTTSTLYGAYIASGSETSILTAGDFHNLLFDNNSSQGGGYGVSVFGLAAPLATNIVISNNQLINAHSNAIYIRETDGVNIHRNFIDKTTANVTSWNAIQIAQSANINARIHNNYIQVSQTSNGTQTFRGIYLFNGMGHQVFNNIITNINLQSGNVNAIDVRTGGTAPQIYFNTISIDSPNSTSGNLAGIAESLSNTNAVLRDNLISISQPCTGVKSGLVIGSTANPMTAFNSDYNIIYVPGGNVAQRGTLTPTFYPTLANWQGASGQDANSYAQNPLLESLILPKPTNQALDDKGLSFGGVALDYFGVSRGTPPDIGAIEFGGCPPPATPGAIVGDNAVCLNAQGVAYSVAPNPSVAQYNWTVPFGAAIASGQGTNAIVVDFGATSGNITVTAQDSCGVSGVSSLVLTVFPPTMVTLDIPQDTVCSTDAPFALNGGNPADGAYSGPGVSGGEFSPSQAGVGAHTITLTYEDEFGCTFSATDEIVVEVCSSAKEALKRASAWTAFPNPTTGQVYFRGPETTDFRLRVYDGLGRLALEKTGSRDADLSGLPAGIYTISISADGQIAIVKVSLIEK